MVLLWPLVTGRPAAAVADEPPPYYDCQGNALTPEEFDALVERLAEIAAGYGQVFSVPFGYCDEGPLVIEGLPAECTFSQGWRNYLSDSPEAFLLEPLDVVLFTVDELIANGLPIAPEDAQVLRAHNFRIGYLAGVVQTTMGEAGFYGRIISAADQSGVWSVWVPVGVLSADEIVTERAMRVSTGGVRWWDEGFDPSDPRDLDCILTYQQCLLNADNAYDSALQAATQTLFGCLQVAGIPVAATLAVCVAAAAGSGPGLLAGLIGCGVIAGLHWKVTRWLQGCDSQFAAARDGAQRARASAYGLCYARRSQCFAQNRAARERERAALAAAGPDVPEKANKPARPKAPRKPSGRMRR